MTMRLDRVQKSCAAPDNALATQFSFGDRLPLIVHSMRVYRN